VRLHHLFAVVVFARESANDSSQPCSGAVKALRGYNLNYQNDADTGQLQLSQVTMFGKDDTPERFINLPVATYSYGQVTDPDNKLHYKLSQRITALPDGYDSKFDATFGDIKTVIGFYCGGAGCHNETQSPNLFPNDDAKLYATLTTYKVTKCGGRVLVKPCAPEDSAFYRAQNNPTTCETLPQMPFGCGGGNCTQPDDLEIVRQWIAEGAPKN
jgi:hypothetical protein